MIRKSKKTGYNDIFPELLGLDRKYSQSHTPPPEQKTVVGHAVRAVYMYSAMADIAAELGDRQMLDVSNILYDDIVKTQMYVTGAIGSTSIGESFTTAYDLPNDLIYGETCASVGLMMFCRRMNAFSGNAKYADTMERALYNTVLAGISLSGTEFFYVNPLETEPLKIAGSPYYKHVKPVRQKWFDCSCCPTNIARTIMGLGGYLYGASQDGLYVNLYCSSTAKDGVRSIAVKTDYPYGGKAVITARGGRYKLFLRNPQAAPVLSLKVNGEPRPIDIENGYIVIEEDWHGEEIRLTFDMRPKRIYSALNVQENAGKAAVMRGPLVYCMEQADNGERLGTFLMPVDASFKECPPPPGLPSETVALELPAYHYVRAGSGLYSQDSPAIENAIVKLIPYFLWANRGENEMRVYISTVPPLPERSGK